MEGVGCHSDAQIDSMIAKTRLNENRKRGLVRTKSGLIMMKTILMVASIIKDTSDRTRVVRSVLLHLPPSKP